MPTPGVTTVSAPDWAPTGEDAAVVWRGGPRRGVVLRALLGGVVLAAFPAAAAVLGWRSGALATPVAGALGAAATLAVVGPPAVAATWRRHTRYLVTERALYHRSGILRITVTELGLEKVQNTSYAQSVLGRAFDHGTVTVETAGGEGPELRFRELRDPAGVHALIAARTGGVTEDESLPGTVAQWRAVLEEVRRVRRTLAGE